MTDNEYVLTNPPEYLLAEFRKSGSAVTRAYLGEFGYTTDDQTDQVCDAINDLMRDTPNWETLIWDCLDPDTQRQLMLLAADSDTFMEKGRLPSWWVYQEEIKHILDMPHDHIAPCDKQDPVDVQVGAQSD